MPTEVGNSKNDVTEVQLNAEPIFGFHAHFKEVQQRIMRKISQCFLKMMNQVDLTTPPPSRRLKRKRNQLYQERNFSNLKEPLIKSWPQ